MTPRRADTRNARSGSPDAGDAAAAQPAARRGRPRATGSVSSREAFLATTSRLLRRQGYAATGLNEIVAASGAPRGSLYFHFPGGKEELAVTAMQGAGARLAGAIEAVLGSSEDVGEALARLVDGLAAGLVDSGYANGCPIATVALEAAGTSEPIRDAAAGAFDSWLDALRRRLRAAGLDSEDAARRAVLVLAAIEGALILARAQRDPAPLTAVREELVALCR
jgi:TetR/AcrR family transcriptional repressor of lmrAB and yxaGH operons